MILILIRFEDHYKENLLSKAIFFRSHAFQDPPLCSSTKSNTKPDAIIQKSSWVISLSHIYALFSQP
jgi:hypothetical protein